jgi:anthranilate phosphoribosyltransferase
VERPTDRVVVDTCGTGGDGTHTFNISTVSAIVAAGAGVTVAKHGNRSVSSSCGSADVLKELGVEVTMSPERMARCMAEAGIAFLFAPTLHAAMRHVIGARREIGIRTLFNILGPLSNPAGEDAQLLGVYDRRLVAPLAAVLGNLGVKRAMVVHGSDGLDEITLTGKTTVAVLREGVVREEEIDPRALGLSGCAREDLVGGEPKENARIALQILSGKDRGPRRAVVLLNSAAAILLGGAAVDLEEGMARAAASIDSGAALKRLERLKELSRG